MIFTAAPDDLLDLLSALFSLDPIKRPTCKEALKMSYFRFVTSDLSSNISTQIRLELIRVLCYSNRPPPSKGSQLPLPTSLLEPDVSQPASRKRKHSDSIEGGTTHACPLFSNFGA